MLGIGGGTLLVPTFKLGFGFSAIASTATSLFTIIPTSISGVVTHIHNKTCIPRLGVAAGIGGAITSSLGVWLATLSPEWAIMAVAAAVIFYSAYTMFTKAMKAYRAQRAKRVDGESRGWSNAASANEAALARADVRRDAEAQAEQREFAELRNMPLRKCLVGTAIGLCAGIVSGYVGVGGGFIMIPMMMQVLHTPMKLTSGTSLIAIMLIAIPGTITQAINGNIDWVVGCAIAAGSIPGAMIGSRLIKRIPEVTLRFMFSIFLLVAAAFLVLDQLASI